METKVQSSTSTGPTMHPPAHLVPGTETRRHRLRATAAPAGAKLFGFVAMELARVDASFCTFRLHSGLAMGSIYLDGSGAKAEVAAAHGTLEKIGCFGLRRTPGRLGNGRWPDDRQSATATPGS